VTIQIPETQSSNQKTSALSLCLVVGCALTSMVVACASVVAIGIAFYALWYVEDTVAELSLASTPFAATQPPALAELATGTAEPLISTPSTVIGSPKPASGIEAETARGDFSFAPPSEINQTPLEEIHWNNHFSLLELYHPPRDYYENAARLSSGFSAERTVNRDPYRVGDRQVFKTDEGRVEAELLAVTEHAYFWVDRTLEFDPEAVKVEAERFEDEFYPVVNQLFGEEWRPGVDNDDHFSVLHLAQYDSDGELGFFSSGDEYPWAVVIESNQQEMVYLNMANLSLGTDLYHGTLIHELQHLILWHNDANESIWLAEGMAQLTELYAGLNTVDTATDYLHNTDIQLNSWEFDDEDVQYAHYGAAYLFSVYLWEQVGKESISALAKEETDGIAGVRTVLAKFEPNITLEEFIANWTVANYLDDFDAGPEYGYANLRLHQPEVEGEISSPGYDEVKDINQFGVHYIAFDLSGPAEITFVGDTTTELMSDPGSGVDQIWYAPAPDEMDAQLTADFDLSGLENATLQFSAWYDLEANYDFAYITISTDDGITWDILEPGRSVAGEYGPALSGRSQDEPDNDDGWIVETIDLDHYTGQPVTIRFELLTDSAIGGGGFALNDITIPELTHELGGGISQDRWSANGFARTGWVLPQSWAVTYIEDGADPQVTHLELNELNQGQWFLDPPEDGGVLVIAALNPFTEAPASYWLRVDP